MTKALVLVADDDANVLALCRNALEEAGYEVDVAYDGVEALERIGIGDLDALLTDVQMPRIDGLTVCRIVKSRPEAQHLPIIVMTGSPKLLAEARGIADEVVLKPFDLGVLLDMFEKILPGAQTPNKVQLLWDVPTDE
jgi:CheY-like chemotaxis protein